MQTQSSILSSISLDTMPKRYSSTEHTIDNSLLNRAALEVCNTLYHLGFESYIVGGAVRDILLTRQPKDFDIATNATPEQIIKGFRRARIIGKRFKIVHIMIGRELIEVTTFRGNVDNNNAIDSHGRILADNTYGNLESDAIRRDVTVNALYYNPNNGELIDFHNGIYDLKHRQLRMIGEPNTRYREDPVRMLRIIRLAAKLEFTININSLNPIFELKYLINHCPTGRLFDEVQKLFMSGYAIRTLHLLQSLHLDKGILNIIDKIFNQSTVNHTNTNSFIYIALNNTDERINTGQSTNPSFLFACLLWNEILNYEKTLIHQGEKSFLAREQAISHVLNHDCQLLAIPHRFSNDMSDIWKKQIRFEHINKKNLMILKQPRFRAAYDFFLLRCQSGEYPSKLGEIWTTMHLANNDETVIQLLETYLQTENPKIINNRSNDSIKSKRTIQKKRRSKLSNLSNTHSNQLTNPISNSITNNKDNLSINVDNITIIADSTNIVNYN